MTLRVVHKTVSHPIFNFFLYRCNVYLFPYDIMDEISKQEVSHETYI